MSEPLFVARIASDRPSFTDPATFTELFDAVHKRMPVSEVFFWLQTPTGFTLKKAGTFILQFQPDEAETLPEPALLPEPLPTPTPQAAPPIRPAKAVKKPRKPVRGDDVDAPVDAPPPSGRIESQLLSPAPEIPSGGKDPNSHLTGDW